MRKALNLNHVFNVKEREAMQLLVTQTGITPLQAVEFMLEFSKARAEQKGGVAVKFERRRKRVLSEVKEPEKSNG